MLVSRLLNFKIHFRSPTLLSKAKHVLLLYNPFSIFIINIHSVLKLFSFVSVTCSSNFLDNLQRSVLIIIYCTTNQLDQINTSRLHGFREFSEIRCFSDSTTRQQNFLHNFRPLDDALQSLEIDFGTLDIVFDRFDVMFGCFQIILVDFYI